MKEVKHDHLTQNITFLNGFPMMYDVCDQITSNHINEGCTYRHYYYNKECGQRTSNDNIECDFHIQWRNELPKTFLVMCIYTANIFLSISILAFSNIMLLKCVFSLAIIILLYVIHPIKRSICKHVTVSNDVSPIRCCNIIAQNDQNDMCEEHCKIGVRRCLYFNPKNHTTDFTNVCGIEVEDSDLCTSHLDYPCYIRETSSLRFLSVIISLELILSYTASILLTLSTVPGLKMFGQSLMIIDIFITSMIVVFVYHYYRDYHL